MFGPARVGSLPLLALLVLLAGCSSGAVEVDVPQLGAEEARACEALIEDLPETLFGQERRDVEPADATAAAWGDPAVLVLCGVDDPVEYNQFSSCTPIGGAGWFMPDAQLKDQGSTVEITAMSHSPKLQLVVPPELRGEGADSALATLGPLVARHLSETLPCH